MKTMLKTTVRLVTLLMAMLMVFPFAVFAYEPDPITINYLSGFSCSKCGVVHYSVSDSWNTGKLGPDAGCCWRQRYYWDITCLDCGYFHDDYLVRYDYQYHLFDDPDGDGVYNCVFCMYED